MYAAGKVDLVDVNADGKLDLVTAILGDYNSRANSGSVYIIYNSLIDDYSGTGNNVDMATSSNYNIRYDGAGGNDYLGRTLGTADIDGNGGLDLFMASPNSDFNGRADSGSVYVIYDSLIDDYSGTGNNVDMATSSNYNIRYDGEVSLDYFGHLVVASGDFDNDDNIDLILGASSANFNSRSTSGSFYIVKNSLIDDYSGTGNNVDMATSSNYNIRYDGAAADEYLGGYEGDSIKTGDIDGDGMDDILVSTAFASNNSRTESGSSYVIFGSLVNQNTGIGNQVDLLTSSNYNIRYDGAVAYDYLSGYYGGASDIVDFNSDGNPDILLGAPYADYNSRADSGVVYVVYNALISALPGTGNTVDLSDTSTYTLRYDGATAGYDLTDGELVARDINNDGSPDLLIAVEAAGYNSRSYSGSAFIIYNFPHTLTANVATGYNGSNRGINVTGTISAPNSVTTISGVQYKLDNNSPTSGWTDCTANDGVFNGRSEAYTCSKANLSAGSHTVYIRAKDTNTSYTAQSNYGSTTFTIGSSGTNKASASAPQIAQVSSSGKNVAGTVSPARGNAAATSTTKVAVHIESDTMPFAANLTTNAVSGLSLGTSTDIANITTPHPSDPPRRVQSGGVDHWQLGSILQMWYTTQPPDDNTDPAIIIPELQEKPSIISFSYTLDQLFTPGAGFFPETSLQIAHSLDGVTWTILPTSVVDTTNKTVGALHRVGGYYMIVKSFGTPSFISSATRPVLGVADNVEGQEEDSNESKGHNEEENIFAPPVEDIEKLPVGEKPSLWQRILDFIFRR